MSKTNKPYRQILNMAFIIVPQSSWPCNSELVSISLRDDQEYCLTDDWEFGLRKERKIEKSFKPPILNTNVMKFGEYQPCPPLVKNKFAFDVWRAASMEQHILRQQCRKTIVLSCDIFPFNSCIEKMNNI
jgi:hypothetical protein